MKQQYSRNVTPSAFETLFSFSNDSSQLFSYSGRILSPFSIFLVPWYLWPSSMHSSPVSVLLNKLFVEYEKKKKHNVQPFASRLHVSTICVNFRRCTWRETPTDISRQRGRNESSFVNLKRIRKQLQRALDRPGGYSINTNQRKNLK